MVCSACGYENQAGNRFCGMCGTPLPHPPLTAPGAHGTHTFTRVPLGNRRPVGEGVGPSAEPATGAAPQVPSGIQSETAGIEREPARNAVPSAGDMVPEVPLDDYVKSFRYVPPADPDEMTMRGEAQVLRRETPPAADAPAAVPAETTAGPDENPVSASEDVRERLGLDELAPQDEHHDRPRFLELSEPALPADKAEAPVPAIAGPSFLGLSVAPKADAPPVDDTDAGAPSRDRGWTWLAVAALLVFVALGVVEWRSQVNQTDTGPVEVVKTKLRNLWRSGNPTSQSNGSAEADATKPAMQAQPATTQQAAGPKLPPDSSKAVPAPKTTEGMGAAAATRKSKAQAAQEVDSDIPIKKPVPGADEVAKANDASDAAAAAAWLWKATSKGNPEAPVRLADMYVKGDGVPRSCEQALVLLQAAATKGNAQARTHLAQMYNNGLCVQRNLVKAYRWLSSTLSADPNSRWALQNRDLIWQEMTPEERVEVQQSQ